MHKYYKEKHVSNIYYKFPPPNVLCMYFSAFANKILTNVSCFLLEK
jgi:hypothetical protein